MYIMLSLLVCIIGALVYALSSNPKLVEMGRLAFACGLFVFLLRCGEEVMKVFSK